MPHDCLADFLESLHRAGQLLRITAEVDPQLELAAITHRVAQSHGPALLFEHVRGHDWPVVTNLLGTAQRVALALGVDSLEQAGQIAEDWLAMPERGSWLERIKRTPAGTDKLGPRQVKQAACQQVVKLGRDVDLVQLPAPRAWPLEIHRTLTSGRVCWREPGSGRLMLETLPAEILGPNRLAIAWQHDSALRRAIGALGPDSDAPLPVAIVLGGDPIYGLLTERWSPEWCRFELAARLRNRAVNVIRCRTQPVEVPADGDLVIEGYLDRSAVGQAASDVAAAGPLAGPSGHYLQPLGRCEMLVTAATHRTSRVLPAMVHGAGLHEALSIDLAVLALLRPLVARAVPELVDYHAPCAAGWNPALVVSIRKRYPGHARQAAAALWGLHATAATRLLIVVDEVVDVRDMEQVMRAIGNTVIADRDVWTHHGPASSTDHASRSSGLGAHLAIDATAKLPGEHSAEWPPRVAEDSATRELVIQRWREFGLPGDPA